MAHEKWLLFVDTNILLDFYRLGGASAGRQLAALERRKASLIVSEQVKMEFLKNRQKVIVAECVRGLKAPEKITMPPILADCEPAKAMSKHLEDAKTNHKAVKQKVEKVLTDPAMHDYVYAAAKRIFAHAGPLNLGPNHPELSEIHRLAKERWLLGYPPRKDSDTSIGDAVNWEWVVRCASKGDHDQHVCIVSRDADYGIVHSDDGLLNDWLREEFETRVGGGRKIRLTNFLTHALKLLDEPVAEEDKAEEQKLIELFEPWPDSAVARQRHDWFARYISSLLNEGETIHEMTRRLSNPVEESSDEEPD